MKYKVLFAGLDQELSTYIKKIVEPLGCEISSLDDGNKALDFLGLNACDCVIAELDLQGMNGFLLYKRGKELGLKFSYVLLANSKAFVSAEEAYEVGIESYLLKPVTREVLSESVIQILGIGKGDSSVKPSHTPDSDFSSVPLSEFFMGGDLQFPLFLKLSTHKYVEIGVNERSVDRSIIEKLKKNNVKDLYLRKEDFIKYLGFMDFLTEASVRSSKISSEKKIQDRYHHRPPHS